MLTVQFLVGIGWPIFWCLPFAGGLIRDNVRRDYGSRALRTLELIIIAAWVLLIVMAYRP